MQQTFGARLRRHREKRDISLKAVAEQTKIKLSLLEGLERDDISQWPTGIFRRAYLRSYAHAIGLNPDVVAREFFDLYPPPVEVADAPPPPPPGLRGLVGSALGSLARRRRTIETSWPTADLAVNLPPPMPAPPVEFVPSDIPEPDPDPPAAPEQHLAQEPEAIAAPPRDLDLLAAANICTELGRVESPAQIPALLMEAARILDARGLIVWVWDALAAELKPALVHGYSDTMRSRLPSLRADADNITAEAFRSACSCAMAGNDHSSGALVVPLLRPVGCAGVLALELPDGTEKAPAVRAVATFIAAMLAQLVGVAGDEESVAAVPVAPVEAGQHA
jgi:transcriptional regulator with XRE-family HTH domain